MCVYALHRQAGALQVPKLQTVVVAGHKVVGLAGIEVERKRPRTMGVLDADRWATSQSRIPLRESVINADLVLPEIPTEQTVGVGGVGVRQAGAVHLQDSCQRILFNVVP